MNSPYHTIEEVHATLKELRQSNATRRRFPQALWDAIIALTRVYSLEEVCQSLDIHPVYLKRKMHSPQTPKNVEFEEIKCQIPEIPQKIECSISTTTPETVLIRLVSRDGLSAKIQGPLACLNCLNTLFGS